LTDPLETEVFSILTSRSLDDAKRALEDVLAKARAAERRRIVGELQEIHNDFLQWGHYSTTLRLVAEAARFVEDPAQRELARKTRRAKRVKPE